MTVSEFTSKAAHSQSETFKLGPDSVTVLSYFYRQREAYDDKFQNLRGALLETWRRCGRMRTVVVTNEIAPALARFIDEFPWVEAQVELSLIPGKLSAMSIDCNVHLYQRFQTDYVLIVQDDGFPIREGLTDFLGKYDYIGAPFVRHSTWYDWYPYPRFCVGNGGFSLRSRRICEAAAKYYSRYFKRVPYFWPLVGDDTFYCKTLRMVFPSYRREFRFAPPEIAGLFSFEGNEVYFPQNCLPLGFHSANAFLRCWQRRRELLT